MLPSVTSFTLIDTDTKEVDLTRVTAGQQEEGGWDC